MNIDDAIDVLKSGLQDALEEAQDMGSDAMAGGDLRHARQYLDRAESVTEALQQLAQLEAKISELVLNEPPPEELTPSGRLQRGVRTPESVYKRPILEVLVEMGGGGQVDEVLQAVLERVRDQLNDHDFAMLSSGSMPRWRNTAMWARNALRADGLIRSDSRRGIWEISDKGRRSLQNGRW